MHSHRAVCAAFDASKECARCCWLTQVELASRLNATQTFISKCERGERRLDIVELKQWCEAIGLSLVELAVRFEDACNKRA
ncbi:helix-turn-helix domain-containing protein [Thauera humireducens]|uniref:helix-turn-helix domain-containing protein n=1 Tax=Thauera humireducens TaxID=1134435 RepID=UPI003C72B9B9